MLATRLLRSKFMVGISVRDVAGSTLALRKAIRMAHGEDEVIAIHVPKKVTEMLLTSMSDPSDADEATMETFSKMPLAAGENLQKKIKATAEKEMMKLKKTVKMSYKMNPPASDVKIALAEAGRSAKIDMLFLGPGVSGNGGIPAFLVQRVKGYTVCVVRDHIE
mmetsp:Transcript_136190/g.236767  ORF Transcript_136190/g.236767 Transcript_136190/m.236767 type:complete len:164 (-) Transcript_136190:120-611(-)